jgi:hypothetical protein
MLSQNYMIKLSFCDSHGRDYEEHTRTQEIINSLVYQNVLFTPNISVTSFPQKSKEQRNLQFNLKTLVILAKTPEYLKDFLKIQL